MEDRVEGTAVFFIGCAQTCVNFLAEGGGLGVTREVVARGLGLGVWSFGVRGLGHRASGSYSYSRGIDNKSKVWGYIVVNSFLD